MPRINFASEREIQEVMAAECEAANIVSNYLFDHNIHDQLLGNNWRERIENFGYDVRNYGSRIPHESRAVEYQF